VQMVVSAANRMLTPAALEAATVAGDWENHSTGGGVFGFSSDHFPLGFECDDAQLKGAATLLRVLFVNDLRNLQTQVDRLIVEMQVQPSSSPPSRATEAERSCSQGTVAGFNHGEAASECGRERAGELPSHGHRRGALAAGQGGAHESPKP
jgi:hypothetical protein